MLRVDANIDEAKMSDPEVEKLFKYVDTDNSGEIESDEFKAFLGARPQAKDKLPARGKMRPRARPLGCYAGSAGAEPRAWAR